MHNEIDWSRKIQGKYIWEGENIKFVLKKTITYIVQEQESLWIIIYCQIDLILEWNFHILNFAWFLQKTFFMKCKLMMALLKLTHILASLSVGVEHILWTDDWLNINPVPRIILPTNRFQNVCLVVISVSHLKEMCM